MACRGCLHIVGPPHLVDQSFESRRPRPNPPPETYYRRLLYQVALDRLAAIADAIAHGETERTGKAYRNEQGDVVRRGKGVMPTLLRMYPETKGWSRGPAALRKTILEAKTPEYFTLLQAAVHAAEADQGEQLELFIKTAPRADLAALPPVVYPAHRGNRRCKICRRPHAAALHRFHLHGAFDQTHIGPARADARKKKRDRDKERWREEIPF